MPLTQTTLQQTLDHLPRPQASKRVIGLLVREPADVISLKRTLYAAGYLPAACNNVTELVEGMADGARPQAVVLEAPATLEALEHDLDTLAPWLASGMALVILSEQADIRARLKALRAQAARYLLKPVPPARVRATLDDLLPKTRPEPYRVLMVDDSRLTLEQQAHPLRSAGMEVATLQNPLQTLEVLEAFRPDVVVLDIYMPEASGAEVAAVLRQLDDQQHLPILFISGEDDLDQQLQALRLGGDDFLVKPVRPQHLVAAVSSRAQRARRQRAIRHQLELERYERERVYSALDHHAIVSVADQQGVIIYANDKFCEISGYRREELLGHKHNLLNSGTHAHEFFRDMWATISAGQVWVGEVCNRRRDGSLYWVKSSITPFMDSEGLPYQYISVRTDITHLKETQAALTAARDEADRANRAKSEFLANMSHELRTPLHAILGFAQLMQYDKALPDKTAGQVQHIRKAGQHLLGLIDEVLDLAKIEAGRIDLSPEPVDLNELVKECLALVQPMALKQRIAIAHEVAPGLVVQADRSRLKQVLLNLLSNAIKYNREGGRVHLQALPQGDGSLRLQVSDTGRGIAPDQLQELFKPFTRLEAEKHHIEGTGIGLTITKRIVELMGGEVGVSSEPGVGSQFWIELPNAPSEPQGEPSPVSAIATAPALPPTSAPAQRPRVLYIEDNPANIALVGQIMGLRPDVEFQTAHLPGLGIDLAHTLQPALVLLDINMPELDGYAVLKALRESPDLKDTPVLAVSANASARDVERGLAAGFNDYLAKPFNVNEFLYKIDTHLQRRQPTRTE